MSLQDTFHKRQWTSISICRGIRSCRRVKNAGIRLWQCAQGIRAAIAVDQPASEAVATEGKKHRETYFVHADRDHELGHFTQFPGDARAALAPFLAHRHLEPDPTQPSTAYKWILFGDDDTLWFMEGVLNLLQTFDHDMPLAITDEIFWHSWGDATAPRFHEDGPPRCLPCHFNQSGAHLMLEMHATRHIAQQSLTSALHIPPCTALNIMSCGPAGLLGVVVYVVTLKALELEIFFSLLPFF